MRGSLKHCQDCGEETLAEPGTAAFYREQVTRIMLFAEKLTDPVARRELVDIAATFQRLADRRASGRADLRSVSENKSA